jgi:hypothetical protein
LTLRNYEKRSLEWWYMTVIPALERQRQDCKLEASLDYSAKPCLKKARREIIEIEIDK